MSCSSLRLTSGRIGLSEIEILNHQLVTSPNKCVTVIRPNLSLIEVQRNLWSHWLFSSSYSLGFLCLWSNANLFWKLVTPFQPRSSNCSSAATVEGSKAANIAGTTKETWEGEKFHEARPKLLALRVQIVCGISLKV